MRLYLTWARSMFAPRDRLLPGLGARLARYPRLATAVLVSLRRLPAGQVREAAFRNVSRPLLRRMRTQLEVPVSGGSRMVVDTGDLVGSVLAISGTWEPQVTAAFRALLSPGAVCIDVGAHIGYFTLVASKLVGPTGHVYALEPAPRTYAALRTNLDLNRAANVTALRIAAGDTEGESLLSEGPPGNTGSSSIREVEGGSTWTNEGDVTNVRTRRLDSLIPTRDTARVKLVKIDVEGYEVEVLHGLEGIYAAGARPAIIVEFTPQWRGDGLLGRLRSFCANYGLELQRLDRDALFTGRPDAAFRPVTVKTPSREQQELLLTPLPVP